MKWKWNNLLIFHKQNERRYWLGLLNILGLFKTKPENFFGIFLNRTIHNKQKKSTLICVSQTWQSFYWSQVNLKYGLTSQGQITVSASEEDRYLSIDLCLCLYRTFTEIYIQASTSSYYDCSPMSIIQSSCNVFYFRRYYFQTSHFLSIFFWKLEFFHYLHLFYITYLLVVRCVWHLLLSSQLAFNYQKHTILKTSQNVMYGVNLWYTEKHCNAGKSKAYTACSTQLTTGIVRTHLKHYTWSSHRIPDFLEIKRILLKM